MSRPPPRSTLFPYTPLSRSLVREELGRRAPEQQAPLPQGRARHPDRRTELRALEPGAGLVREPKAENIVVEADRGIEILHRDADVMQTFHGSSVASDEDLPAVDHVHLPGHVVGLGRG